MSNATHNIMPTVKKITINGKPFICGLFWQPLTRPRAYMKEAREIGKRESMDIVAIRRSTIIQAGFVSKNQGVFKGMYSMAAALAGMLGPSWLGVFDLEDGCYVLVAVHNSAIVPGCDMAGNRDEVSKKLNAIYGLFSWGKIYIPAGFNHHGETFDLKTLLKPARLQSEYQLKSLTFGLTQKEWIISATFVTAILVMISGALYWKTVQQRQVRQARLRAEQLRQRQLAELNARARQKQTALALEHPWAEMPSIEDFLTGCLDALNAMPLTIRGWIFETAQCDGKRVAAVYKRSGHATVNDFIVGAQGYFESEPAFHDEGERSSVGAGLKLMAGGDDSLQPLSPTLARFSSHFQAIGIKPTLAKKTVKTNTPHALPGQPLPDVPTEPNWKTFTFSLATERAPTLIFAGLEGAGIRCTELSAKLKAAKLSWNVAGEIYAK